MVTFDAQNDEQRSFVAGSFADSLSERRRIRKELKGLQREEEALQDAERRAGVESIRAARRADLAQIWQQRRALTSELAECEAAQTQRKKNAALEARRSKVIAAGEERRRKRRQQEQRTERKAAADMQRQLQDAQRRLAALEKQRDKLNKEAGGAQAAIASLQKLLDSEKVGDAIKEMNAMNKELEKQTKSKKTDEAPLKEQVEQCQKIMDAVVLYSNNL